MPKFTQGDLVTYGWWVGSRIQFSDTVYRFIARNGFGDSILENIDDGSVFLAKLISRV